VGWRGPGTHLKKKGGRWSRLGADEKDRKSLEDRQEWSPFSLAKRRNDNPTTNELGVGNQTKRVGIALR